MLSERVGKAIKEFSWIRKSFDRGQEMKLELGEKNVFDLSLGNPVFEPPKEFQENLLKLAQDKTPGTHRYMSNAGYLSTRKAVADTLSKESGLSYTADDVVMACGTAGATMIYMNSVLNPGDEVIVLAPYFSPYLFFIRHFGADPVIVQTNSQFQLDFDNIEAAINERTKCLILNSPNNPTGAVYPEKDLRQLAELLRQKQKELGIQIDVISDEVYNRIVFDDIEYSRFAKFYENTVVVNSSSKDLSIPGERIGYAAIHPEYPEKRDLFLGMVFSIQSMGFTNAPALMQRLIAQLQNVQSNAKAYQDIRDRVYDELIHIGLEVVKPEGAFYMYPKTPIPDDIEFTTRLMEDNQVLVIPGTGFGRSGYFRLAYCVEDWEIEGALEGFRKFMKSMS